jgi:hypothetical protein
MYVVSAWRLRVGKWSYEKEQSNRLLAMLSEERVIQALGGLMPKSVEPRRAMVSIERSRVGGGEMSK